MKIRKRTSKSNFTLANGNKSECNGLLINFDSFYQKMMSQNLFAK